MKTIRSSIWLLFIGLIVSNLLLFYSSIKLSDDISLFEKKIQKIHHENLNFEKELARLSSLQFAQKIADSLNFTKKSQPSLLEKLVYAFNANQ